MESNLFISNHQIFLIYIYKIEQSVFNQTNSYDFKQYAFLPRIVVVMEILYWQVSEGFRKEEGEEG